MNVRSGRNKECANQINALFVNAQMMKSLYSGKKRKKLLPLICLIIHSIALAKTAQEELDNGALMKTLILKLYMSI